VIEHDVIPRKNANYSDFKFFPMCYIGISFFMAKLSLTTHILGLVIVPQDQKIDQGIGCIPTN
jgi:hypothetical protein